MTTFALRSPVRTIQPALIGRNPGPAGAPVEVEPTPGPSPELQAVHGAALAHLRARAWWRIRARMLLVTADERKIARRFAGAETGNFFGE